MTNISFSTDPSRKPNPQRITRNSAQCLRCKDVVVSAHRHDFVVCGCGAIAVDGGLAYLRRVGNPDDMLDLSTYGSQT